MKMCKWSFRYWLLKWRINRDKDFLLKKALEKALLERLEINLATQLILEPTNVKNGNNEKNGRIYLPPTEDGLININSLLEIVKDDCPEVFNRWYDNEEKLYG